MWNVCCFLASTRSLRLAKCEVHLACTTVKCTLACTTVKCVWHAQLWSASWHTQLWSTLLHAQLWSVLWHARLWSALWYAQLWSALWHAQLWSALWHAQLWSMLWHICNNEACFGTHKCASPSIHTAALSLYKSQDAHLVSHSIQLAVLEQQSHLLQRFHCILLLLQAWVLQQALHHLHAACPAHGINSNTCKQFVSSLS